MKLKHLVFTAVLVVCLTYSQVSCRGHSTKSRSKKKHTARGKQLLERSPREARGLDDDGDMRSICKTLCSKATDSGKSMRYGMYDPTNGACECVDRNGAIVKKTVKKAKKSHSESTTRESGRVIISKGEFSCNETSKISRGLCKVFCETFRKSDSHTCSNDGLQCLCYAFKAETQKTSERVKRGVIVDTFPDTGEEFVTMNVGSQNPLRRPKYFGNYLHGNHDHDDSHALGGPVMGCTPYSCVDQCPYGCDSLCRYNRECYCSCPEDLTYEYYDDFSIGSILG